MDAKTLSRFWSKVDTSGDCWLWKAGKFEKGYGAFKFQGKLWKAHRFAWFLEHGPIPPAAQVNHHCDTPGCVKPEHLYLGSQLDNRRDAVRRQRTAKGRRNGARKNVGRTTYARSGSSKLTDSQIARMVHDYLSTTMSAWDVARLYGVTDSAVLYHVRKRRGANPKKRNRLSAVQVREIVSRYEAGESAIQLGIEYGVTNGAVYWHVYKARQRNGDHDG
jgi:hypothetical protein